MAESLPTQSKPVKGWASYKCYACGHEWNGRAEQYPDQMDPSAINGSDRCRKCGTETDDVMDWTPAE